MPPSNAAWPRSAREIESGAFLCSKLISRTCTSTIPTQLVLGCRLHTGRLRNDQVATDVRGCGEIDLTECPLTGSVKALRHQTENVDVIPPECSPQVAPAGGVGHHSNRRCSS